MKIFSITLKTGLDLGKLCIQEGLTTWATKKQMVSLSDCPMAIPRWAGKGNKYMLWITYCRISTYPCEEMIPLIRRPSIVKTRPFLQTQIHTLMKIYLVLGCMICQIFLASHCWSWKINYWRYQQMSLYAMVELPLVMFHVICRMEIR